MDFFEVESSVRGHHVYMEEWTPSIGETLDCQREETNEHDPYTVAIVKRTAGRRSPQVVGHVPRRISAACNLFLQRSGNIECTVTAARRYSSDLPQGGLEVPCQLRFSGDSKLVSKIVKLLKLRNEGLDKSTTKNASGDRLDNKEKVEEKVLLNVDDVQVKNEEKVPLKVDNVQVKNEEKVLLNVDDVQVKNDSSSRPWLSLNHLSLTYEDKEIIQVGGRLNDKHMNFAQIILKQQFNTLQGLHSTLLLFRQQHIFASGRNVFMLDKTTGW